MRLRGLVRNRLSSKLYNLRIFSYSGHVLYQKSLRASFQALLSMVRGPLCDLAASSGENCYCKN